MIKEMRLKTILREISWIWKKFIMSKNLKHKFKTQRVRLFQQMSKFKIRGLKESL